MSWFTEVALRDWMLVYALLMGVAAVAIHLDMFVFFFLRKKGAPSRGYRYKLCGGMYIAGWGLASTVALIPVLVLFVVFTDATTEFVEALLDQLLTVVNLLEIAFATRFLDLDPRRVRQLVIRFPLVLALLLPFLLILVAMLIRLLT